MSNYIQGDLGRENSGLVRVPFLSSKVKRGLRRTSLLLSTCKHPHSTVHLKS